MIVLKNPKEIEIMRQGGRRLRFVLEKVLSKIRPGVSENKLDKIAQVEIEKLGGKASFKMVPRYHWASCLTVNEEVVHGVPSERRLAEGDIIGVDLGMFYQGFHTDLATTVGVGKIDKETARFLRVGQEALEAAIHQARPGNFLGDLSLVIQQKITSGGYRPVTALTGHGIGRKMHEEPSIPCVLEKKRQETVKLKSGMTLAVEVIYNLGSEELVLGQDGWTISTWDGKISGLFEETVAVTKSGPQVLTR